jgi:hypothetical protein
MVPKASLQQYADRFLHTDVAIIANNETHVVMAVRVPLELISENHHLLRDLSDAAGLLRIDAPSVRKPARPPAKKWIVSILFGLAASIGIGAVSFQASATDNPVEVSSAQLLTPQVQAGGELVQIVVEHRRRECAITVDRAFIRKADDVVVLTERVPGIIQGQTAEPVSMKIAVAIPKSFKPGEYIYRSAINSRCDAHDGGTFIVHKPDLSFEVLPRASNVSARGRRG